jgi:hypothetical protein
MTISIKPTDRFFIMAVAEDLEGVKEIKTYSASAPQCESLNEIGCLVSSLSVPNTFKVGGGSAVTRLWLPVQMEVIGAKCPPKCKLVSWRRGVFAIAVNCSGLKNSTPTASFTMKYP